MATGQPSPSLLSHAEGTSDAASGEERHPARVECTLEFGSPPERAQYLVIVHRAHPDVFRIFKTTLEEPGIVDVMWDRRRGERRHWRQTVAVEHRRGERRSPPLESWDLMGFVVVPWDEDRS